MLLHALSGSVCLQMAESVMTLAFDSGVNLFDTAEVYASGRYPPDSVLGGINQSF